MSVSSVDLPRRSLRLTAWAAMALIVMLSVLSASPRLHAWLHAQESAGSAQTHAAAGAQDHSSLPTSDDDGCAVVLFSAGLTLALAVWLLVTAARYVVVFTLDFAAVCPRPEPADWLPPLCGPPSA